MKQFIDLLEKIIAEGSEKTDRTGVGTISIFGHQSFYDMKDGFPLLSLKETHFNSIVHELLWFLNAVPEKYKKFGNTNIKYLVDHKVNIWNDWALKKYLNAHNKQHIKIDPTDPIWKEEMKIFISKIKEDDEFAIEWGELGSVYGKQWKKWPSFVQDSNPPFSLEKREIDQIEQAINLLSTKPDDRGILVSAWNVSELDKMALRPCHTLWQLNTHKASENEIMLSAQEIYKNHILIQTPETEKENITKIINSDFKFWWNFGNHPEHKDNFKKLEIFKNLPSLVLDLQLYQRSADVFLGVPFNIASYSLLLHMLSQVSNMIPGRFIHTFGDAHIYLNHKEQVKELFDRVGCGCKGIPKNYGPELPVIQLNPSIKRIEDFRIEDIKLIGYNHLGKISAPVAI